MKKVIIISILIIFIFIAFFFVIGKNKIPQPLNFGGITPTPVLPSYNRNIDYSRIFSDSTTQDQIVGSLTNPSSEKTQGQYSIFIFSQPTTVTTIYVKDQKAAYVEKMQSDENTIYTEFKTAHPGVEEHTLYDPKGLAEVGLEWRVFPNQGIAYLTNVQNGFVMTTLYFQPVSYQRFMATIGKDFSLQTTNPTDNAPEKFE